MYIIAYHSNNSQDLVKHGRSQQLIILGLTYRPGICPAWDVAPNKLIAFLGEAEP